MSPPTWRMWKTTSRPAKGSIPWTDAERDGLLKQIVGAALLALALALAAGMDHADDHRRSLERRATDGRAQLVDS